MPSDKKIDTILVSLDVLLDTRLGTIAKIDKAAVEKILDSDTYHAREEDVFEGIDRDLYKEYYKNRDSETLANSMLTNALPLLRHLVKTMREQAIVRPFYDGVRVEVNLHPYKLSDAEQDELGRAIAAWLQGLASVTLVDFSPKDLTPQFCKHQYSLMIMYDYEEWLETNAQLFLKTQIPEITLFVPAIYFVNKPTEEEMNKLIREAQHPMKAIELLAKGIVSLELIDVAYFSIYSKEHDG